MKKLIRHSAIATLFLVLCAASTQAAGARLEHGAGPRPATEEESGSSSPFVVLMTEDDASVQSLFARYPELKGSWEELAKFNLLRPGYAVEIPSDMLDSGGVLAKVASYYGEAEVKRSFDTRFIPLIPNLLLREGDEIRTWRGSGVRILFDDGNYVLLKSQSRAKVVSLGSKPASATSRLELLLKEGSLWSEIEKEIKGRYEIRTATASTIIRGTDFRVKVEPGETTRVEVLEGRVDFQVGDRRISVGTQEGALAGGLEETLAPVPLPEAPRNLLAPEPQEVLRLDRFDAVFRWTAVDSASAYRLEIARDETFFDVVVDRRVGSGASVRIQNIEPGTYFWRASTFSSNGFEGNPTAARYFVFVQPRP